MKQRSISKTVLDSKNLKNPKSSVVDKNYKITSCPENSTIPKSGKNSEDSKSSDYINFQKSSETIGLTRESIIEETPSANYSIPKLIQKKSKRSTRKIH